MKKLISTLSVVAAMAAIASTASAAFIEVTEDLTGANTAQQNLQGRQSNGDYRWTRENVYILTTLVSVLPPATLTIEPGTIVRGVPSTADTAQNPHHAGTTFFTGPATEPGTLIVARGAKLIANGTADDPIIFTSLTDPHVSGGNATIPGTVNGNATATYAALLNYAPNGATGRPNNGFAISGEWGGVLMCGQSIIAYDADDDASLFQYNPGTNTFSGDLPRFPVNASPAALGAVDIKQGDGVGLAAIEGISYQVISIAPSIYTDPFSEYTYDTNAGSNPVPAATASAQGVYGGDLRADNSGVLRFVSIRFNGLTVQTNVEINGLTVGGMGTGTVFDFLENYNSKDDAFEFFGGTANAKRLYALYHADDGIDCDTGYVGNMQFVFSVTNNETNVRSGYAPNNTAPGGETDRDGDKGLEWDGSERIPQDGSLKPNTDGYVYNYTVLGGLDAGNAGQSILLRRGVESRFLNGLVQEQSTGGSGDYLNTSDAAGNAGAYTLNYSVFATGKTAPTQTNAVANGGLANLLVKSARTTAGGLDPRLASGVTAADPGNFLVPANRTGDYAFTGFTKVAFGGANRDSNPLNGWSILNNLGIIDTAPAVAYPARPAVTLAVTSGNAKVSFNASAGVGGRAVLYAVERATDAVGTDWKTIAVVSDGNNPAGTNSSTNPVKDASGTAFATLDSSGTAGTIEVTGTGADWAIAAGTPALFRVLPL